ncbi:MAG: hypothetical protein ACON4Z_09970 [Planctomycetota bacterium]
MRSPRWIASALLLAAAACGGGPTSPWESPPSRELDLRVTVDPVDVALLQPVTVTVDRYRRRDAEVALAAEFDEESWVEQARVEAPEVALGDGRWQRTQFVLLPIRGPGEVTVPALRAEQAAADGGEPAVATSAEVVVRVRSVLGADDGPEIEPPGAPFAGSGSWWPWGLGATALLALLGVAFLRLRRAPAGMAAPVAVDLPAHVRALRELRRWRGAARRTPAEVEAFYVGVSQVLRVYLEERFGLRAPERTTEEFLRDLERGDGLARRHRGELERFLSQCDMVKFAKLVPSTDDHDRTYALAEAFVESTRSDRADARGAEESVT